MRKRRTREHIIADLSVNYVERLVLKCGFVLNRFIFDYGHDLYVKTFNEDGEVEANNCLIQMKASDAPAYVEQGKGIAMVLERRDIDAWIEETMPVFLIVYDAQKETAYWLHIQSETVRTKFSRNSETVTLRLRTEDVLNQEAIRHFRQLKEQAVRQEEKKYD